MVKEVGMYLKPNPNKLSIFILQTTLLSFCFPVGFLCDKSCDVYAFDCGNIGYLAYPFWGENQPESCGHSGFKLVCVDNVPMLNISSLAYRVLEIDFGTNTLKVARDDLPISICSPAVANTSIDFNIFKYSSESKDVNVTLYYDCKVDDNPINQFSCNVNGGTTVNLFETGSSPNHVACKYSIFVPINQRDAQSLRDPTASSINVLKSSLGSGFSIQWLKSYKLPLSSCDMSVYGACIGPGDGKIYRRACDYWSSCIKGDSPQGPASGGRQEGPPPVQSPPAKSGDNNTRTRKVPPPVQSPGSPAKSGDNNTRNREGPPPIQSPGSPAKSGDNNTPTREGMSN